MAEVILQQTPVDRSAKLFEAFVRRFPTVEALATASEASVLKRWEGWGYYGRARRLHQAARRIVRGGLPTWPRGRSDWEELPGVGPYIAASLASQLDGERVAALDTNGRRVAARWLIERRDPSRPAVAAHLAERVEAILPSARSGDFNEALMELGERVCRARRPLCTLCPVAAFCRARQELTDPAALPRRTLRRRRPLVRAAAVGIEDRGRWLVQRRPAEGLLGGLWEFPGGKIEEAEPPEAAARRELREETGLRAVRLVPAGVVRHAYSHFAVELHLFRGALGPGRAARRLPRETRWVSSREFGRLPRPTATVRAFRLLRAASVDRGRHAERPRRRVGASTRSL